MQRKPTQQSRWIRNPTKYANYEEMPIKTQPLERIDTPSPLKVLLSHFNWSSHSTLYFQWKLQLTLIILQCTIHTFNVSMTWQLSLHSKYCNLLNEERWFPTCKNEQSAPSPTLHGLCYSSPHKLCRKHDIEYKQTVTLKHQCYTLTTVHVSHVSYYCCTHEHKIYTGVEKCKRY